MKWGKEKGASLDELITRAIEEYLFAHRFRLLRERMASRAQEKGIYTDQDVFERVSFVLDTNVLIAALVAQGVCSVILEHCKEASQLQVPVSSFHIRRPSPGSQRLV